MDPLRSPTPWLRFLLMLAQLERGDLDLMPDMAQTDERLRRFAFHQTPALQSWSQLYRRPGLAVNTVLDLQGLRIAVLRDSVQESTLRAMLSGFGIQAELVPVASFAQAFQAVADGRADLAAVNHFFGGYQSGRLGWSSDIASRMGGDEFVVILTETDAAGATHFAQRLIEAMRAPVHVAHSEISVGLSIGVALFPDDGTEADVLLRKADAAMYQAKAAGRNDLRFFTPELQARSDRLLALSTALAPSGTGR